MLKQVSVFAENKAGKIYEIMNTLALADVNVRALTIAESNDYGIARLIVDNHKKAGDSLKASDIPFRITDVIGFTIPDKPGALCNILQRFGVEGVNIRYSYSLIGISRDVTGIVIRVSSVDSEKAKQILSDEGVTLLNIEDIV